MKIGLMTWFSHYNFGTSLQALALYSVLKKEGFDVEIINYIPHEMVSLDNKYSIKNIKNKAIIRIKRLVPDEESFKKFLEKNINFSEKCNNYFELKELSSKYDLCICGSDQIWSPLNFDNKYFLNFAEKEKIISYAPSLGVNKIDKNLESKYNELIQRFKYLSVREETAQSILKKSFNIDSKVVLDPTLLLNKKEWNNFIDHKVNINNRKYLVCYFLGNSNKYYNLVKKISKEKNLEIINIPIHKYEKINKYNIQEKIDPSKFLYLISNAELVLTDSYHGMLFSINYNKDFFVFKRFKDNDKGNQNSRVLDFLQRFNLNDRLIFNYDDYKRCSLIKWTEINEKLSDLIIQSKKFLFESINNIKSNKSISTYNKGIICKDCSGCGACKSICPKNAIKIEMNREGFYNYSIDKEKCIGCGLCKKVCPLINIPNSIIDSSKSLFSYKSKKKESYLVSSSGGFSNDLCNELNKEWYVCGVKYSLEDEKAKHILISPKSTDKLNMIQGSKYLQSFTGDLFEEIVSLSKTNKILFTGTPCQIAGLHNLLKIKGNINNVLLIETICHGVPSYLLWEKYLKELRETYGKVKSVIFRDKSKNSKKRVITIKFNDIEYSNDDRKDNFYAFFRRGVIDNKSCYECPYRNRSFADIRIGDFWGEKYKKEKYGTSMIIILTEKGEDFFKKMERNGVIKEENINDYFDNQYTKNMNPPICREEILDNLKKDSLSLESIRKSYLINIDKMEKNIIIKLIKKIKG